MTWVRTRSASGIGGRPVPLACRRGRAPVHAPWPVRPVRPVRGLAGSAGGRPLHSQCLSVCSHILMTTDRTAIVLIGTMLAGLIAVTQPTLIPALGIASRPASGCSLTSSRDALRLGRQAGGKWGPVGQSLSPGPLAAGDSVPALLATPPAHCGRLLPTISRPGPSSPQWRKSLRGHGGIFRQRACFRSTQTRGLTVESEKEGADGPTLIRVATPSEQGR